MTIPLLDAKDALENCDVLNVLMTQTAQCVAIVGEYENFHVHHTQNIIDFFYQSQIS